MLKEAFTWSLARRYGLLGLAIPLAWKYRNEIKDAAQKMLASHGEDKSSARQASRTDFPQGAI
jgi:hypothetical protein